jgi:arsenate reductase
MTMPEADNAIAAVELISRRRFVAVSAAFVLAAGCSTIPKRQPETVLFICEFGTAKSVIAREMFRRRAAARNIAVDALSRGLVIEDHITPELRRNLSADGIDPYSEPFKVLQPQDWQRASVIVAFNSLPDTVPKSKVRDWTDVPSVVSQYPAARVALAQRIEALLDEFAARA